MIHIFEIQCLINHQFWHFCICVDLEKALFSFLLLHFNLLILWNPKFFNFKLIFNFFKIQQNHYLSSLGNKTNHLQSTQLHPLHLKSKGTNLCCHYHLNQSQDSKWVQSWYLPRHKKACFLDHRMKPLRNSVHQHYRFIHQIVNSLWSLFPPFSPPQLGSPHLETLSYGHLGCSTFLFVKLDLFHTVSAWFWIHDWNCKAKQAGLLELMADLNSRRCDLIDSL